MMKLRFSIICLLIKYLVSMQVYSIGLVDFDIANYHNKSILLLNFEGIPSYTFHILHHPERIIVDIPRIFEICLKKFPINFSNGYLIQNIYIDNLVDKKNIRFVFDLNYVSCVDDVVLEKGNGLYTLLLIVTRHLSFSCVDSVGVKRKKTWMINLFSKLSVFQKDKHAGMCCMKKKSLKTISAYQLKMFSYPIVVAIDAGHGGHDPGAMGYSGLYEKDITFAIAKKLKKLLDNDFMFSPVMIRDGDYFISVFERSELARRKGAKILLSIHTDAVRDSKHDVRGASVWVLSDRRANVEMTHWLKNIDRWAQLSGRLNNILISSVNSDPYFNRAILDLQFYHSQRVGYEIALHILGELKNVGLLHKYVPEYSNFGILRSLDIPSILIETGFITHKSEEKLLASDSYQERVACAVYSGLRSYFLGCSTYVNKQGHNKLCSSFKNHNKCLYEHFWCRRM